MDANTLTQPARTEEPTDAAPDPPVICRRCDTALPVGALFCHCCALTGPELHWAAVAIHTEPIPLGQLPPAAEPAVIVLADQVVVVPV